MTRIMKSNQQAVDENYTEFKRRLPELIRTDAGKFVVLRDCQVVRLFDDFDAALDFCHYRYPDGLFSVQEVTQTPVEMGYFSHVMLHGQIQPADRTRRSGRH